MFNTIAATPDEGMADKQNALRAKHGAPASFVTDDSEDGELQDWKGPTFTGDSWKITTYWTEKSGVTFYLDGGAGDEDIAVVQIEDITEALAAVKRL